MQAISYQAFKHFYEYSNEKLRYRDILYFGLINLHYEIRICQKIYNRVTTHSKSKCLVRNSLHQMLYTLSPRESSWDEHGSQIVLLVNFRNKYVWFSIEFQYKTLNSHYKFIINCRWLKRYHAYPSQLLTQFVIP